MCYPNGKALRLLSEAPKPGNMAPPPVAPACVEMSVPYDLVGELLKRCWWCKDDDLQGAMGFVVIGVDGDAEAVAPGSFGKVADVAFAGIQLDFVLDGVEEEAFEVTIGVEGEA